jgi:hypothetical protein
MIGFVNSPTVPADGNAITSGQQFSFSVQVRHSDGTTATEANGNATFSVSGGQGTGESVPSGISISQGTGSINVTLKKVLQTGDSSRNFTSTFSWNTGTTSADGHFNELWLHILSEPRVVFLYHFLRWRFPSTDGIYGCHVKHGV